MGIVSSEIIEDSLQAHGRRYLLEKHIDHLGRIHLYHGEIDVGGDAVAQMNNRIVHIDDMMVQKEIEKYIEMAESGIEIDPTTIPDYATKVQVLKALIKQAFLSGVHTIAFSIIAIIDSLTDTQIRNIVNIDRAKVDKIRNRVINLKLIRAAVNSDSDDIEELK